MNKTIGILTGAFMLLMSANIQAHTIMLIEEELVVANLSKQQKMEALLTSKKWVCMEVSKKRLTKKLDFDIGNEFNLGIDKKYNFKNNNYDYSNGKWKLDGKMLYFFYDSKTDNKTETTIYQVKKLDETTLILKRTESPKGKITFK